ncbi:MAG: DNA polymerase III subunit alpha [Candidatus Symbiodolus clandestinus]
MKPQFIHLRLCSEYSLTHGLAKVGALVEQAANYKMPAMALTDSNNLFGLVKFYQQAQISGIKPIIGADCLLHDPQLGEQLYPFTLLAAQQQGYQNLTQLISRAYLRGHIKGAAAIDREWLAEHSQGLILLSGGILGDVGTLLLRDDRAGVERCLDFYQRYFFNHYYLEISRIGQVDEVRYLESVLSLARKTGLPVVATHPACFLQPEDFEAHEIRVAIHQGRTLADQRQQSAYTPQQYFCPSETVCERFADLPEALENSVQIAKRCNVTLRLGEPYMPTFPTGGMSTEAYLIQQAEQGLMQRLQQGFPDEQQRRQQQARYQQRLSRELAVINQMGFPGYFLIVMEFIQWSKRQGIPVGPGRGSGPGSLVAYALQITDLDPIAFDLLFERFLNPDRVSLPDFDIDFCMDRRDEVIEHVAERYGRHAVAQIITFGTLAAKAVIRDVGRVLGHPYGFVDAIAKLIPFELGMTLEKALGSEPRLQQCYEQDEEVRALIDSARKLEGVVRNAGKHAGGVVIAPTAITDFAPLFYDPQGQHPVTQFDKNDVETAGLVKFDFLGLRTLTIIQSALQTINAHLASQQQAIIELSKLPLDDPLSFQLLQTGETTAIFQLESRGMKDLIKRLQPDCFEDLIALVALFRPGPLQSGMVDNFIDRKHGRENIAYPDQQYQHLSLKPTLEPTYGIILYQEQVMQIAQVLAGYTLGEADLLRRAMGKKKPQEMAQQREIFEQGAKRSGIDGTLAIKIFDLVEKFAGYGFNKSHSAAYALVSYQTLWLKAHYPAAFMAAVLSADLDNTDKVVSLIEECRRLGLTLLPPDINGSDYGFTVISSQELRFGLGAIKGIGRSAVESLVTVRQQTGPFRDLFDLCARIDSQRLQRRTLEKLIMAGALDSLSPQRARLLAALESALKGAEQQGRSLQQGQVEMFKIVGAQSATSYPEVADWSMQQRLSYEKQTLGLYLSGHPITAYLTELERSIDCRLAQVKPTSRDQLVRTAGLVVSFRLVTSQQGKQLGLLVLEDGTQRLEVLLFSEVLAKFRPLLERDRLLIVAGSVSIDRRTERVRMVAQRFQELQEVRAQQLRGLTLRIHAQKITSTFFQQLETILQTAHQPQGVPIKVDYQQPLAQVQFRLGKAWQIYPSDTLIGELQGLLGPAAVILHFD